MSSAPSEMNISHASAANTTDEKPKLVVLWTKDRDNPRVPRSSNDYCKINAPGSCIFTRNTTEYEVGVSQNEVSNLKP